MRNLNALLLAAAVTLSAPLALGDEGPAKATGGKVEAKAEPAKTEAKADAAKGDIKMEPKDARPVSDNLVSPDAANAVDEADLMKRLTGDDKAPTAGPEKMFAEVMGRMGDSAKRLKGVDPGEVTQETQRRIVLDLDSLIEMAKEAESKSSGKPGDPKPGDKKGESKGNKSGKQPGPPSMGGDTAAQNSQLRDGTATAAPGTDMHAKGIEGWGNLPPRDRDIVTQSQQENFLPSYRVAIQRYYEELARLNRAGQSGR